MAVIVSSVPRSRVDIMLNGMWRIVIINQFFFSPHTIHLLSTDMRDAIHNLNVWSTHIALPQQQTQRAGKHVVRTCVSYFPAIRMDRHPTEASILARHSRRTYHDL
jgi:hypothetical protein